MAWDLPDHGLGFAGVWLGIYRRMARDLLVYGIISLGSSKAQAWRAWLPLPGTSVQPFSRPGRHDVFQELASLQAAAGPLSLQAPNPSVGSGHACPCTHVSQRRSTCAAGSLASGLPLWSGLAFIRVLLWTLDSPFAGGWQPCPGTSALDDGLLSPSLAVDSCAYPPKKWRHHRHLTCSSSSSVFAGWLACRAACLFIDSLHCGHVLQTSQAHFLVASVLAGGRHVTCCSMNSCCLALQRL